MNGQAIVRTLYRKLLTLYPRKFSERLGESMEQTFNDLYLERRQMKQGLFGFVIWTFLETLNSILQEHVLLMMEGNDMKNIATNPKSAALVGSLFIAPFVILNSIVASRIEPFFSFIRPGPHTGPFEYPLLFMVLLLIPLGAFIAIRPIFTKRTEGERQFFLVNVILAALLLFIFVMVSMALGAEIYRCDILQIPNCD